MRFVARRSVGVGPAVKIEVQRSGRKDAMLGLEGSFCGCSLAWGFGLREVFRFCVLCLGMRKFGGRESERLFGGVGGRGWLDFLRFSD